MGRLEQLHQLTSSQRSGMLFPYAGDQWNTDFLCRRFGHLCVLAGVSALWIHTAKTLGNLRDPSPSWKALQHLWWGNCGEGDLCHAETEAKGLLRDQPGKVRQRSIQEMIGEGNKWKGGINEHPFLQKIKIVESKMYKWRIRKGENNQIAYVEKVMRKGNWNDSFISLNSTYFVLLGPRRKAGMAGMIKSIGRTYLRWIS